MPIFLWFNNYIEFLIQSLSIVRNMQNSSETRSNLSTELGLPVVIREIFGICENESQPGLQLAQKLATPLTSLAKTFHETQWPLARRAGIPRQFRG